MANADVDGPRNILFGINAGALDGSSIVGITESVMADLKKAHRTLSALIEPVLHLAFIYDRINGKLVGTLEIDGCDDTPYIVGQNFSKTMTRGLCWIRENRDLRAIQAADLARTSTPEPAEKPVRMGKQPRITVSFNEEPDCVLLEMAIPDTSDPPFAEEEQQVKQGLAAEPDERGADIQIDEFDESETILTGANNHYFFEEKALRLNLCVCNKGSESVEHATIKLGFPRIPGFHVVDCLYTSPFDKRRQHEAKNLGYPDVEYRDNAIIVRGSLEVLTPNSPKRAFKRDLRMAVGPRMQRKKIAVLYSLRGPDKQSLGAGRLKIKFGRVSD